MRLRSPDYISMIWVTYGVIFILSGQPLMAQPQLPAAIETFLETHCLDCHDAEAAEVDFNLEGLSRDLADRKTLTAWVQLFNRMEKREMPPPEN